MIEKDFPENIRIKRYMKNINRNNKYIYRLFKEHNTIYKSTYNAYFYLVLLCINTQLYTYIPSTKAMS